MFKITLAEAEKLIDNYRAHFFRSGTEKVPNTIGGTLRRDLIDLMRRRWNESRRLEKMVKPGMELHEGLAYWSCWKQGITTSDSDFFLAFEFSDGLIVDYEGLQFPDNPILVRPFEIVEDDSALNTADLLASKEGTGTDPKPDKIKRGNRVDEFDSVLKACKSFQDKGPRQASMIPYNQLPFGLFENKNVSTDVDDFLNTDLPYIRYYFGYEPDLIVNKIRVILIAVNKEGKNSLPSVERRAILDSEDPIILQTSWPPR